MPMLAACQGRVRNGLLSRRENNGFSKFSIKLVIIKYFYIHTSLCVNKHLLILCLKKVSDMKTRVSPVLFLSSFYTKLDSENLV